MFSSPNNTYRCVYICVYEEKIKGEKRWLFILIKLTITKEKRGGGYLQEVSPQVLLKHVSGQRVR